MKEDPEALPFILDDIVELDFSTPYKTKFHDIPSSKEENGINKRLKTKILMTKIVIKHVIQKSVYQDSLMIYR